MRPGALLPLLVLAAGGSAFGQGDPLVSKSISRLLTDGTYLWAFAADGPRFSRIDLFADPVDIRNGVLPFLPPVLGGAARSSSVLVFSAYRPSDTTAFGYVASVERDGKAVSDSLLFQRGPQARNAVTTGVEISALALRAGSGGDTLVLGAGNGGIALDRAKPQGQGGLSRDTLVFRALPRDDDTAREAFRCVVGKPCLVDKLKTAAETFGEPDSVIALAVDSSAADSVWLLIGTNRGLRRGLLGGNVFPPVAIQGRAGPVTRVQGFHVDSRRNLLWAFTGTEFFFSDDHGRTFRVPPKIAGVDVAPADIQGFSHTPQAASSGDTTYINFNLDAPGLVAFRRDTLLANVRTESDPALSQILIGPEDGLDIEGKDARLTALAVVGGGSASALAAGSNGRGLFLRKPAAGPGAWLPNINSLKRLKSGLDEIITFPTLFSGATATGEPEFVNIGYRLKKDGRVTITVYNYAMEKVKTLVRNAPRKGGGARSEKASEDRWDGRDASGRRVSVGTYYILVESDKGEKGWGKAIAARGRQ